MDSTVDAMAAAYDALIDAAAVAAREPGRPAPLEDLKRCLDAFKECCDRAEDLVQTAAAGLGPSPSATSALDALCRTVHAIEKDLVQAAAADDDDEREEKEAEEEKDPVQTLPTPVAVAAEDE